MREAQRDLTQTLLFILHKWKAYPNYYLTLLGDTDNRFAAPIAGQALSSYIRTSKLSRQVLNWPTQGTGKQT
jgi:hypothetical protein